MNTTRLAETEQNRGGWNLLLTYVALTAALLVTACQAVRPVQTAGQGEPAAVSEQVATTLTIVTHDHTFEAPSQIAGGWVRIKLTNEGAEPHHVQLVRLNDGVTGEQFLSAMQETGNTAFQLVTLAGGPGAVDTGGQQEVTVNLEPGNYFLLCFVPDAEGVPHLAHGMLAPIEVTAATGAPEPSADIEVSMVDFSFVMPDEIKPGAQTWKILGDGAQPHELNLIKLADGKTVEDVMHWMHAPDGPPPFANVGGMQGIDPQEAAYLHLDLTPGAYVAICHIPDPASGKAHEELGMVRLFTVGS